MSHLRFRISRINCSRSFLCSIVSCSKSRSNFSFLFVSRSKIDSSAVAAGAGPAVIARACGALKFGF